MKLSRNQLLDLCSPSGGKLHVSSLTDARQFCRSLARGHYENFPVASLLVPRSLQAHMHHVYAFARVADDLADEELEISDAGRIEALNGLEALLDTDSGGNPIFTALAYTRRELAIPADPFRRLLRAFRSDVRFIQPETMADLEAYCENSANPVGELVLRIFGLHTEQRARYSDAICTGLQLANFWQDFSRDLAKGRVYIPREIMERHRLSGDSLTSAEFSANFPAAFANCLSELYGLTRSYFDRGVALFALIPQHRLRAELAVVHQGGLAILRKAEDLGANIRNRRPALNKWDYCQIIGKAMPHFLIPSRMKG